MRVCMRACASVRLVPRPNTSQLRVTVLVKLITDVIVTNHALIIVKLL